MAGFASIMMIGEINERSIAIPDRFDLSELIRLENLTYNAARCKDFAAYTAAYNLYIAQLARRYLDSKFLISKNLDQYHQVLRSIELDYERTKNYWNQPAEPRMKREMIRSDCSTVTDVKRGRSIITRRITRIEMHCDASFEIHCDASFEMHDDASRMEL